MAEDDVWGFRCHPHDIELVVRFPQGYDGVRAFCCPRCDEMMEVTFQPVDDTPEVLADVASLDARRKAKRLAEAVRKGRVD